MSALGVYSFAVVVFNLRPSMRIYGNAVGSMSAAECASGGGVGYNGVRAC